MTTREWIIVVVVVALLAAAVALFSTTFPMSG